MKPDTHHDPPRRRILVVWFRYTVHGGIGRFLNIARVLNGLGHVVRFASLTDETSSDWPDFPGPILPFAAAQEQSWDAVMVPGASAPAERLALLARLREPRFGLRVQHILNDTSRAARFRAVSEAFAPHIIISNNSHWQSRDGPGLAADFYTLPGAVDTDLFYPAPRKRAPCEPRSWAIGAFATKTPPVLLDAVEALPADHVLHVYGVLPRAVRERGARLASSGRLVDHGPLFGAELTAFYRRMDVVVTAETHAGWCNTAAEAMACGLPCVVTPAGTLDFARHLDNALVVTDVSGKVIAAAIGRLTSDAELRDRLACHAARTMRAFDWYSYCQRLLNLLERHMTRSGLTAPPDQSPTVCDGPVVDLATSPSPARLSSKGAVPVLAIVGMHRSGTSLTANWLQRCGLDLGEDLIPPHATNPAGHYEDRGFVRLHRQVLSDNGLSFLVTGGSSPVMSPCHRIHARALIRERNDKGQWGWKDPRTTLFLTCWKRLVPELRVLAVYRPAVQVVDSLLRREPLRPQIRSGMPHGLAWVLRLKYSFFNLPLLRFFLDVWETYNQRLASYAKLHDRDCIVLSIHDLPRFSGRLVEMMRRDWRFTLRPEDLSEVRVPGLLHCGPMRWREALLTSLQRTHLQTARDLDHLRLHSLSRLT
jgi:glycosyltransferase involved in cell wall biosynthesis